MNYNETIKMVTDELCNIMENGTNPWIKPWKCLYDGKPNPRVLAYNYITKKAYRGINQLILPNGYYATMPQINKLGGRVNKGAKAKTIVFFKFNEYECQEDEKGAYEIDGKWYKRVPCLRFNKVFNLEDTTIEFEYPNIDDELVGGVSKIEEVENVLDDYVVRSELKLFEEFSDRAYYSPLRHEVHIPLANQFEDISEFYSTKCHELVHSTAKFFDRECVKHFDGFGGQVYSREELIAEMGSAYCLGYFGIDTTKSKMNSSAYLKGWAKEIRGNESLKNKIVGIITESTKAFEMIVNVKEYKMDTEEEE